MTTRLACSHSPITYYTIVCHNKGCDDVRTKGIQSVLQRPFIIPAKNITAVYITSYMSIIIQMPLTGAADRSLYDCAWGAREREFGFRSIFHPFTVINASMMWLTGCRPHPSSIFIHRTQRNLDTPHRWNGIFAEPAIFTSVENVWQIQNASLNHSQAKIRDCFIILKPYNIKGKVLYYTTNLVVMIT